METTWKLAHQLAEALDESRTAWLAWAKCQIKAGAIAKKLEETTKGLASMPIFDASKAEMDS